jgi:hypothetical protein
VQKTGIKRPGKDTTDFKRMCWMKKVIVLFEVIFELVSYVTN